MNAAPFAQLEARVGRAISARLANGYLVPEGGVALPVVFSRPQVQVALSGITVQASNLLATVLTPNLDSGFAEGSRCAIFHDDQLQLLAGEYLVRQRDDDIDAGQARLELEIAPA